MASRRELEDEVAQLRRELRRREDAAAHALRAALRLDSAGRDLAARMGHLAGRSNQVSATAVKTALEQELQPEVAELLELLG